MRSVDSSKSVLLRQAVRVRRRALPRDRGRLRRHAPWLLFILVPIAFWRLPKEATTSAPATAAPAPASTASASPTIAVTTSAKAVPSASPSTTVAVPTTNAPTAAVAPPTASAPSRARATKVPPPAPRRLVASASRLPAKARATQGLREHKGSLRAGRTLLAALQGVGLSRARLSELLNAAGKVIDFKRCREGDRYRLLVGAGGRPERLEYYGAQRRILGAKRLRGKLVPFSEEPRGARDIRVLHGRLHSSLEAAVVAAGGRPQLAARLADLFAWDLDFNVDPRVGDTFSVAIERIRLPDGSWREGDVLGAEYHGESGEHSAYRFSTKSGDGYYDAEGRPLRRRYLASPLPLVRITSKFGRRWHPILSRMKHHGGVDYAAPKGTPVWAMGSGRVEFVGRKGGFGKLVVLKHADGVRTYYAHLSRFAEGLRRGKRVRQKDVIGRVGATGLATGPHLHFGMKRGGGFFDPAKVRGQRALPLPKKLRKRFLREMNEIRSKMRAVHVASLDGPRDPRAQ